MIPAVPADVGLLGRFKVNTCHMEFGRGTRLSSTISTDGSAQIAEVLAHVIHVKVMGSLFRGAITQGSMPLCAVTFGHPALSLLTLKEHISSPSSSRADQSNNHQRATSTLRKSPRELFADWVRTRLGDPIV